MRCKVRHLEQSDIADEMLRQVRMAKEKARLDEEADFQRTAGQRRAEYECRVRLPGGELVVVNVIATDLEDPMSKARHVVAAMRGLDVMEVAPSYDLFVRDVE